MNRLPTFKPTWMPIPHRSSVYAVTGLLISALAGAPVPLPQLAALGPFLAYSAHGVVGARAGAAIGLTSFLLFSRPTFWEAWIAIAGALAIAWLVPMLMERQNEDRRDERNGGETLEETSAVVIDCDGFSSLDDVYGSGTSDHVFAMLRNALQMETRSQDTIVEAQDRELILVLEGAHAHTAESILGRVEKRFSQWLVDAGYECDLSVGFAIEDEERAFDRLVRGPRPGEGPYVD